MIACTDAVNPGATVTCDSTGSNDPDGSIAEYEWSVDGGVFTDAGAVFTTTFAAGGTTRSAFACGTTTGRSPPS